jgi:SAM-dependent methyltransferase
MADLDWWRAHDRVIAPIFPVLTRTALRHLRQAPASFGVGSNDWTILDLGGGTGAWGEAFHAQGVKHVVVVDVNPDIAALGAELHQGLRFICGRVEALPLRAASVDLIVSRNSLHFWSDLPTAFRNIFEVLRPGGGAFLGRGFGPDLDEQTRTQVKEARKALRPPHEATPAEEPASPEPAFLAHLADSAGLHTVATIPDHHSHWLLFQRPLSPTGGKREKDE